MEWLNIRVPFFECSQVIRVRKLFVSMLCFNFTSYLFNTALRHLTYHLLITSNIEIGGYCEQ